MPTFEVKTPVGVNQILLKKQIKDAIAEATRRGKLRPNSVDSLTGENSGNNLGPGTPVIHFEQWERDDIEVKLLLKGGGCENMNAQYSLPAELPHLGPRRPHHGRRAQVHPARGVERARQGLRARRHRRLHRRRSHQRLRRGQAATVPQPGRCECRRAAGRSRGGDHAHRQHARRRSHGIRRAHLADRLQGRRAEPPAGQLLRVGRLRLLGLSPARRDPRRHDRRDQGMDLSRSVGADDPDDGPGRLQAHRQGSDAARADRRSDHPLAQGRRRGHDQRPGLHRPRRRASPPGQPRAARWT